MKVVLREHVSGTLRGRPCLYHLLLVQVTHADHRLQELYHMSRYHSTYMWHPIV